MKSSLLFSRSPPVHYMHCRSHFNLLLCLFGPTRENHPLQLETSWTVAGEPFPLWVFFFLPSAVFRCVWERRGYHSSSCTFSINCQCYPWIKTMVIFCTLKLLTQGWIAAPFPGAGKTPTERLKKKWSKPLIQSKSCLEDSACHHTQLFIRGGVTFNEPPFNGCVGQKIMCTQWQGCRDHADKIPIDGSLGTQGKGIGEGMPFSPPSGGKPICRGLTSANSQEVLIKTYFAQVITVWWWHKKWARDTVQNTIIRCNIWLAAKIIVLFYWV